MGMFQLNLSKTGETDILSSMLHTCMCLDVQLLSNEMCGIVLADPKISTKHKVKIQICHTVPVPLTNCEQCLYHYRDMRLYIVSDCSYPINYVIFETYHFLQYNSLL